MAIYIEMEGIKGDATHSTHKGWMDVQSLQWGSGRGISTPVGSGSNREASQPHISEVTITRATDIASSALFFESCTGKKGKKVTIHFVTTGDPGDTYIEITLTDVLVSGYSSSSGGDRPTESVSLNFTKIEYKYTPYDAAHTPGDPLTFTYDLALASKG